ncbi:ETC complex I subunit conserved region-domain-containing protein [Biscogniauxia mediterranea]|nr:ETC complex I subunit conserved region-domain-containing protein [Biscogniauxia mediterranea]
MRGTHRLLASVKPRYFTPGSPTGLTGLLTHSSPRSTLLYLYNETLERLKPIPETSLYRQSIEAQTRHRLAIVAAAVPPGLDEWRARMAKLAEANPGAVHRQFGDVRFREVGDLAFLERAELQQQQQHPAADAAAEDERLVEWDGEAQDGPGEEGLRGPEERRRILAEQPQTRRARGEIPKDKGWEPEPQLTADQIEEIEGKIGAGLIEEVIEMAESELKLVDIMREHEVWKPLEEKPAEGQWSYFERNS